MTKTHRVASEKRVEQACRRVATLHQGTVLPRTEDRVLLTRALGELDEAADLLCEAADMLGRQKARGKRLATRYAREHRIAEAFQRALLPDISDHLFPNLAVAAAYAAAWEEARVGGDFYDAFTLEGGRVALAVGDVSGKGLAAAVCAAEIKTALRAFLRDDPCPATALGRLNAFVCDYRHLDCRPEGVYVTLALTVAQAGSGEFSFAVAGAEPPLLIRHDGTMEAVTANLPMLGVQPDARYQSRPLSLRPGDRVLLVTDGITEARNGPDFLEYIGLVALAEASRTQETLQGVVLNVLNGARDFAGGTLADDACLLVAQCL